MAPLKIIKQIFCLKLALKGTHYSFFVDNLTFQVNNFLTMEVIEDVGALYSGCVKSNKDAILIAWFNWFKMYFIELDIPSN